MLLGFCAIAGAFALIAAISHQVQPSVAAFLLASAFAMASLLCIRQQLSARMVLLGSALLCVIGLCGRPLFEDDHYRYLWDGYRTVTSGSPFGTAPEQFFDDERVPMVMQGVLDGINHPQVATIYGPGLQSVFAASYLLAPGNDVALRTLLALAHLALVGLLLRNQSAPAVALYAWNPLVFKEIPLSSHPDALVPLLLLASWQLRAGAGRAALAGLAAATKIVALAAWPLLLRDRFVGTVVAGCIASATLLLTYLPFTGAASDLAGLNVFARDWTFNAALYEPLAAWVGDARARGLAAALAALMIVAISWRAIPDRESARELPALHLVFAILLVLSPVINPWYLLWVLPFAVGRGLYWPWVASLAVLLAYVTPLNLGDEDGVAFAVLTWARVIEWCAIAVAVAVDIRRAWVRRNRVAFASVASSMKADRPRHGPESHRSRSSHPRSSAPGERRNADMP